MNQREIKLYPNSQAISLSIEAEDRGVPLCANGNDFVFVRVIARDKNGNIDRTFDKNISLFVEGGHLIGHENMNAEAGIASFMLVANEKNVEMRAKSEDKDANLVLKI